MERTFAMIKPDAVATGKTGAILSVIEQSGFNVVAMKKHTISQKEAEGFYGVHKERGFFGSLVSFMTSGPSVLLVLEKEGAIKAWRDLMGATNPANAAEGTIRKTFAESIEANSAHGSDSQENAATEIAFFFAGLNVYSR